MPVLQHADTPPPLAPSSREDGAHEAQIFVDDSGRRARRVRMAGLALVATCACWLGALTVGMAGFTGFSPITAGLVPASLHHVLAGRPADHDRVPVADQRARSRIRPVRLAGPAHPVAPSPA
jgi:hypothetical protein